ncbi:unnamed protein product [Prunus brigantina]
MTRYIRAKSEHRPRPSVVKEICYSMVLVLATGILWKMHHWNEQRKVRVFYDLLEKGEISVVAE